MAVRQAVQAGDDAIDDQTGTSDSDAGAGAGGVVSTGSDGFTDEERSQFEEMRSNDQRPAVVDGVEVGNDGGAASDETGTGPAVVAKPAAAAAQPQPGADDDDGDDDADPTQGGKFPQRVSYHKWKRSDERLKDTSTKLKTAEEKLARTDERMKLLVEAMMGGAQPGAAAPGAPKAAAQQDQADEMPDPEQDIFGAFKWATGKLIEQGQRIDQLQNGFVSQNEDTSLRSSYLSSVQKFASTKADFSDAYNYAMATRVAEIALVNYGIDLMEEGATIQPETLEQIAKIVEKEERDLAALAIRTKRDPAQQIYKLAIRRGYRPPDAAPAAGKTNDAAPANSAAASVPAVRNGAAATPAKSAISEAIAAARRGTETNQSLSSGGGAPDAQLTAQQVFDMKEDEFVSFMNTASAEELRAIFGT